MQWENKCKSDECGRFNHCFQWVERKSSERTRICTFMMDFMHQFVHFGMVHEAMRPIKPSVMQKNHIQGTEYQIHPAVFFYIFIQSSVSILLGQINDYINDGKNNQSCKRVENLFSYQLRIAPLFYLNPTFAKIIFEGYPKHQKKRHHHNDIYGSTGKEIFNGKVPKFFKSWHLNNTK